MPPSPTLGATSTYPPSPSPSSPLTRVGTPVEGVVSVKTATEEFEVLRRELTDSSQLHRIKTGQKDLEKDEQDFDLLSFMRSEGDKRDAGGYKRKVVGAVWTGLSVTGVGGVKVSTDSQRVEWPLLRRIWVPEESSELTTCSRSDLCEDIPRRSERIRARASQRPRPRNLGQASCPEEAPPW
jgi:hypothetical protein